MQMNNIRVYDPEVKTFGDVQYFCDDKGRDWYETNLKFSKKWIVQFNKHGVVRAVVPCSQVIFLHPGDTSVGEVNVLPKGFSLGDSYWIFDGKKLTRAEVDPSIPTSTRKEAASSKLEKVITPLRDAVEMGDATQEEIDRYNTLRKIRVAIMRVSDDTPPGDVDWTAFSVA